MTKNKNKKTSDDLSIKLDNLDETEFSHNSINTDEEYEEELRDEEIEESLNEIYQDDKGKLVDVKKLKIMKSRGVLYYLSLFIVLATITLGGGFWGINTYEKMRPQKTEVELSINAKSEVATGEEFQYDITYKNLSEIAIKNTRLKVKLPDNFITVSTSPEQTDEEGNSWKFAELAPNFTGKLSIKGMMLAPKKDVGIIMAEFFYEPENFSSEFKKEASLTTSINDLGLNIDFDYIASALLEEENEIILRITPKETNFLDNFRLELVPEENIEIIAKTREELQEKDITLASSTLLNPEQSRPGIWQLDGITEDEYYLPIYFTFKDKISDTQNIILNFSKEANGRYYQFASQSLNFEVMKSDLNLTLIANGSRDDQGVDFGQTINYSIIYNNKGETDMRDCIIMAILESDFLNWETLNDELGGQVQNDTITWTSKELEALELIEKHEEGTIDFSIQVAEQAEINPELNYRIKSYVQFGVGSSDEDGTKEIKESDNQSNIIINNINSDIELIEAVRYFSEDNIPVGSGPHPPQVDQETTYQVYWTIKNSLHELTDLQIETKLPEKIEWNKETEATTGQLTYNQEKHTVIWNIGRLPITVDRLDAQWSLKIKPTEENRNKIMVLTNGATIKATDTNTKAAIHKQTKPKTTRLEDDEIANMNNTGLVE